LGTPVYWAVLGLVIERPSYGYELVQRYDRRFGRLLPLSSPGQIYKGLDVLTQKNLIEKLPEDAERESRQPKPHYKATPLGLKTYEQRLIAQVIEDTRRSQMFGLELASLPPAAALNALNGYEKSCLAEIERTRPATAGDPVADEVTRLASRLSAEEMRLCSEARLPWIEYARCHFRHLLSTASK
jgi:DNA-binding PadR family transcriptional regulator